MEKVSVNRKNKIEKEVAKIYRPSRRKPFKKVTLSELTRPTDYNEYQMVYARMAFYRDSKFKPVRDLIDNKFEKFFKTLLLLNLDEKRKKTFQVYKQDLLDIFYNDAFQRISNNVYLMNSLGILTDAQKKEREGNGSLLNSVIINAGLNNFEPIINELFEIPNLILSAFDISLKSFKKQIDEQNRKLSDSKKLKPEDESYKTYMSFVEEMINQKITKYKVIRDYLNSNKHINQSEKSLSNSYDSFLKNHKEEIKKKFNLSEKRFNEKFFPATLSKK